MATINPPPIRTELLDSNKTLTYPWQRWFNDLYSYINNLSIQGATGTQIGIQGATGVQGPIGPQGPLGPQGMTGIQGKNSSEAYANFIS